MCDNTNGLYSLSIISCPWSCSKIPSGMGGGLLAFFFKLIVAHNPHSLISACCLKIKQKDPLTAANIYHWKRRRGEIEVHLRVVTCEVSQGSTLHLIVYKSQLYDRPNWYACVIFKQNIIKCIIWGLQYTWFIYSLLQSRKEYNIFIIFILIILSLPCLTVTTKYGLGYASSPLILAPGSHVPHCVKRSYLIVFCWNVGVYEGLHGTLSFGWLVDINYIC